MPLALFVFVALNIAAQPLTNLVSRRFEAEADWVALDTTRTPTPRGSSATSRASRTPTRRRRVGDAALRQPPDDARQDPDGRGLAGSLARAGPIPNPHPPGEAQREPLRGLRAEAVTIRPTRRLARAARQPRRYARPPRDGRGGRRRGSGRRPRRRRASPPRPRRRSFPTRSSPHAALPDARGDLAGRVDARDLHVRARWKARMRLERRPDLGSSAGSPTRRRGVADVDRDVDPVDRLFRADPHSPRSCSTSSPPSIRATTSRSPTRRRTVSRRCGRRASARRSACRCRTSRPASRPGSRSRPRRRRRPRGCRRRADELPDALRRQPARLRHQVDVPVRVPARRSHRPPRSQVGSRR